MSIVHYKHILKLKKIQPECIKKAFSFEPWGSWLDNFAIFLVILILIAANDYLSFEYSLFYSREVFLITFINNEWLNPVPE